MKVPRYPIPYELKDKMITTKIKKMSPEERKAKVNDLRKQHVSLKSDDLYIPKMAYRPSGKDELYVSFFPSELQKNKDIYTEFVSIEYNSEDPKRTLYLWKYNPNWKEDYELVVSNSGFERHIIPVSTLKIISDINTKKKEEQIINLDELANLPNPDDKNQIEIYLGRIANALENIHEQLTLNNLK